MSELSLRRANGYEIGDCFILKTNERIYITGLNFAVTPKCYIGVIYHGKSAPYVTKFLTQDYLSKECKPMSQAQRELFIATKFNQRGMVDLNMGKKKQVDKKVRYKIWVIRKDSDKDNGWEEYDRILELSSIRSLTKRLNLIKKKNPELKIVNVSIVDNDNRIIGQVKFIPREIATQKFITGYKERLLAHAKYTLGYDITL